MTVLAAADLGAQSGRVAVGRLDGDRLAIDEVHRFANEPVLVRGRLQWDVLALYRDLFGGLRLAARDTAIDAVGVDSWASTSASSTPPGSSSRTRFTTGTPAAPGPSSACSRGSPRASSTRGPGSS